MLEIIEADPAELGARHCLASFVTELDARFDEGFDVARSISATNQQLRPPAGLLLIADLGGEPVGCGALLVAEPGQVCDIKRMWVAPSSRGLGVGRRILGELEARAAALGARQVRLETNHALVEAINLYRTAGYIEVPAVNNEPYAHHWFVKHLGSSAPS